MGGDGGPEGLPPVEELRLPALERPLELAVAGQETPETKVFGRLTAWQNWIFQRPNAAGPEGALRRYGTGQRADYDRKRV